MSEETKELDMTGPIDAPVTAVMVGEILPETPGEAKEELNPPAETKKARNEMTRIEQKAVIDWLDADGKVMRTESYWRGTVAMFDYLAAKAIELGKDGAATLKLRAYLKSANDDNASFVLAEGTLFDVLEKLHNRMILAPDAMSQIQMVVSQLAEFSDMKGIMVTAVFGLEQAAAAGFGFLSESMDVSDEDIKVMVSSAEGQLKMFKDQMRTKRNIEFEGDSKIIMPNSFVNSRR